MTDPSKTEAQIVLEVQDLRTYFYTRWGVVKAVDGVSFNLRRGETIGLVGESGCGKTVTCLSLLRLVPRPAGRIVGGRILLEGEDLLKKSEREMRRIRGKKIAMILQDPMTSLNPVFTIGYQVQEPISIHQRARGHLLWRKARDMLAMVKIASPEVRMRDFPHQMSGGMRQRVVGAIALSCQPSILIADEPTTSLDVTIQAQYLDLLKELQQQTNVSLIFITHDLGIVARMCDRVCVMYAGRIVESAPVVELYDNPIHPYTRALIASVPAADRRVERLFSIEGQPPALHHLPPGCPFAPRCGDREERCFKEFPGEVEVGFQHKVSCWRVI
jgi:oligopeptide/dipeptide ABC transporter ATP-binding protein